MSGGETAPSYRPDIDGLRAIAVIAVILYHFRLIPGGFAGVDVFFVLSGYLITSILIRAEGKPLAVILSFYERRIRRIVPALAVVVAATYAAALVVMMPDDVRDLGLSVVAAATFTSNILFWLQSDYFAGPAELKPLLHTWSLAVDPPN